MATKHGGALVLGFALLLSPAFALAQAEGTPRGEKKEKKETKDKGGDGLIARVFHLVPPGFAAELNLTVDQKKQIQALEGEFKTKKMESLMKTVGKVMVIIDSLEADDELREPAPVLALTHEITGALLESRRMRLAYEQKVVALLNADQKATFAELKERPRDRRDVAGGKGKATIHFYYTPEGQDRLQLTNEQKQKFAEMQKQLEQSFRSLLTEDQRRMLDDGNRPKDGKKPREERREKQ